MDWDQLEQLVEVEQTNGNPITMLIHKLELEHDAMILRLLVEYDEFSPHTECSDSLKESATPMRALSLQVPRVQEKRKRRLKRRRKH
jgi:hypothetical protein